MTVYLIFKLIKFTVVNQVRVSFSSLISFLFDEYRKKDIKYFLGFQSIFGLRKLPRELRREK